MLTDPEKFATSRPSAPPSIQLALLIAIYSVTLEPVEFNILKETLATSRVKSDICTALIDKFPVADVFNSLTGEAVDKSQTGTVLSTVIVILLAAVEFTLPAPSVTLKTT